MKTPPENTDPVARVLALVGERWSFLILRQAFFGVRRFGDLQRSLGISRSVLAQRLDHLTTCGLLVRTPIPDSPTWSEYRLTLAAKELYPVILTLHDWGQRHLEGTMVELIHRPCGQLATPEPRCRHCHEPLDPTSIEPRLRQAR